VSQVTLAEKTNFGSQTAYSLIFEIQTKSYLMIFRAVVTWTGEILTVDHLEQHTEYWKHVKQHCRKDVTVTKPQLCACRE
jgi:hypothetical protein